MLWPNEDGQRIPFNHPQDPRRKYGRPLIFSGVIGSSNTLLKQYEVRDRLRGDFGFRAIEMEGAGIAEATWSVRAGYFVVRGICDYCDENKNDKWHDYAALTAAAFAITLLKTVEGHPLPKVVQLESIDPASGLVVAEECFRYVLHELSKDDVFPDRCDRCQEKLRLAHQSITRYWAWSGVKGSAANALVDRLAFDEALLETSDLTAEYRTICLDRTQVSLQRRQMLIRRVTQHLDELTELSGR